MTRIGFYRCFLAGFGAVVLAGTVVTMDWNVPRASAPAPVDLSPPLQRELAGLVQLEAPLEEVDLESGRVFAKEDDESGWVDSGDPASTPLLIRYLKSQDELVQLAALAEFAGMGAKAKKAVGAIVHALQDPKSSIRVEAAVTLIHMNVQAKTAVSALATELRSEDAESRVRAAGAIEQLVNPPPENLGSNCWGPDPPPRIARPWVRKAVEQGMR